MLAPAAAFADGDAALEAVVAPEISKQMSPSEQTRIRYALDFWRISSGISLKVFLGTGDSVTDYGAIFRYSALKQPFGIGRSSGLIYGLGIGFDYTPEGYASADLNGTREAYADLLLNPFARIQWDINGWIGTYIEISYEMAAIRSMISEGAVRNSGNVPEHRFLVGFGIPLEAER